MKYNANLSTWAILFFLLGSCSLQGNKVTASVPEASASDSLASEPAPVSEASASGSLASDPAEIKAQQMFSYSVYERISRECKGNMVCSPLGIEMLYSIMRDGADGNTYNELNKVLGISHAEASSITKDLELPSDPTSTTIVMANLIAVNKPYSLKQAFASSAKQDYGAEIWSKPFNSNTLADINRWIVKKTNGMIPDGFDELDANAVMCGINTIYFNGEWYNPFDEYATHPTVFTNATGKKVKVMMMSKQTKFRYMKTKSFQALAIPYRPRKAKGAKMKNYSLYVFLPLPGKKFSAIFDYLKSKPIDEVKEEMLNYGRQNYGSPFPIVNVKFPRMEVTSKIDVVSLMKSLGVKSAFSANADFGKLSGNDVYISNSQQKAVIRIDEKGTEAAAMTEDDVRLGCAEGQIMARPKEAFFYANRPFIYMIVCEDTNAILFLGQYTDGKIKNGRGIWVSDGNIKDADVLSYKADEAENVPVQQKSSSTHAEDHVYDVVEQMPSFPGGINALKEYIKKTMRYPEEARKENIQGRVILTFIVEEDGSITNVRVAKSISPLLDQEAVRIVRSMPKWIPGKQAGITVRVKYTIPIMFRLDQQP